MPNIASDQCKESQTSSPEWRETEVASPRFAGLETWNTRDVLSTLHAGQYAALSAVGNALPTIEAAVAAAAQRLVGPSGRLIYVGAGTSGRLAVLDAVELTPTFGWPLARIVFLFAGGDAGMQHAREGAEDDGAEARAAIEKAKPGPHDVVLALAASGTTPYTRAAVAAARHTGALTIAFANNPGSPLLDDAEIGVLLRTGPEVLAGSTRLAAGTSQKVALNLFSTSLMIALHKVYGGHMVDMQASNEKLVKRAEHIVMDLTGCSEQAARKALGACGYHAKVAVLLVNGIAKPEAERLLERHGGDLGAALKSAS